MSSARVEPQQLAIGDTNAKLTHYLFRFPAKFHPPVVRALLERYTNHGDLVLDPFCGSGTLLVEAAVAGRNSLGTDVDPLAVGVSRAKVQRFHIGKLRGSAEHLLELSRSHERSLQEYERLKFEDLSDLEYASCAEALADVIPAIPNLHHWFRRYVIIDLARIKKELYLADIPETHRSFFAIVFASIIRNASNADPVPVSGLEVTKWMRERDAAGRVINPFALFEKALDRAVSGATEFTEATKQGVSAKARLADATKLSLPVGHVDAVITSPPYHGAVDYYRRHQLEMFWLDMTRSQQERLRLLDRYVGRPKVPTRHDWVGEPLPTSLAQEWETRIRSVSADRANSFRHYLTAMTLAFRRLADLTTPGTPTVFVVGHSSWNDSEIPTTELFEEIAGAAFELNEVLTYEVKNRYMSYDRHNSADIGHEYVLAFARTPKRLV